MKTKAVVAGLLAVILFLFGCSSVPKNSKAILEEQPERMFWKIHAPNGTSIYVLGTIHFGKVGEIPLQDTVLEYFDSADEIYAELSLEDIFNNLPVEMAKKIENSVLFDEEGKPIPITDYLTDAETNFLIDYLTTTMDTSDEIVLYATLIMPPWILLNTLSSDTINTQKYSAEGGIDFILYQRAMDSQRQVQGLDTLETQLDILSFGTREEQMLLLKSTIQSLMAEDSDDSELIETLVNAYYNDDRKAVGSISKMLDMGEDIAGLRTDFFDDYADMIYKNRNKNWANTIKEMLNTPNKTYFIFAGAAHWLGSDNVFEILKDQGVLTY